MPTAEERAEAKRRHAEKREREERERREAGQAAKAMQRDARLAEAEKVGEFVRATLLTKQGAGAHTPTRVDDLLPDVLAGANLAVQSLLACMNEGLVQPRDLATVASVLMRAARDMQSEKVEEPPSLAELEAAEAEAERLLAERRGRG